MEGRRLEYRDGLTNFGFAFCRKAGEIVSVRSFQFRSFHLRSFSRKIMALKYFPETAVPVRRKTIQGDADE
jgi:hypothetical protein